LAFALASKTGIDQEAPLEADAVLLGEPLEETDFPDDFEPEARFANGLGYFFAILAILAALILAAFLAAFFLAAAFASFFAFAAAFFCFGDSFLDDLLLLF